VTPADAIQIAIGALQERAEREEREGKALLASGGGTAAIEALARAEVYRRAVSVLRSRLKPNMVTGMSDVAQESRPRGRPTESRHPFAQQANVLEWAKKHRYPPSTVKSWYADPPNRRPIPRRAAEAIEKEFGIPLAAWAEIRD